MRFADGSRRLFATRVIRFVNTAGVSYAGMALSVLSAPLLARELGAEARGTLAGSFVLVQLLSWSSFLGLPRGIAVQELREGTASRRAIAVVAILGPVAAIAAWGASTAASGGDERIVAGIKVAAVTLVLSGLGAVGVERALLLGKVGAANLVRASNLILPSVAVILAYLLGRLTLETAFLFTLTGQALSIVFGLALAVPALRSSQGRKVPWRFSLHYWAGSAFDGIGARVDQLILAALVTPSQLGVYAVGVTCAGAAGGLTQALNQLTYARLATLANETGAAALLRARGAVGLVLSILTGTAVVLVVALFGDRLFGPSYHSLSLIVAILVAGQVLNDQWQLRTYADSASGDASALMWSSAIATLSLVVAAVAVELGGLLNSVVMAMLLVGFSGLRLTSRALLVTSKSRRKA